MTGRVLSSLASSTELILDAQPQVFARLVSVGFLKIFMTKFYWHKRSVTMTELIVRLTEVMNWHKNLVAPSG